MARGILALLLVSAALCLSAVLCLSPAALGQTGTTADRGKDRPPARLTDDDKSLWMTEWTACWHSSMSRMSKVLHIPVRSSYTPQVAARKLATRAVYLLYETEPETKIALDGCRNGILWRYYHP